MLKVDKFPRKPRTTPIRGFRRFLSSHPSRAAGMSHRPPSQDYFVSFNSSATATRNFAMAAPRPSSGVMFIIAVTSALAAS